MNASVVEVPSTPPRRSVRFKDEASASSPVSVIDDLSTRFSRTTLLSETANTSAQPQAPLLQLPEDALNIIVCCVQQTFTAAEVARVGGACSKLHLLLAPDLRTARSEARASLHAKLELEESWLCDYVVRDADRPTECDAEALVLRGAQMLDRDVLIISSHLLRPRCFPRLLELDLSANPLLTNISLKALAHSLAGGALWQLQALFLGSNPLFGDAGALALVQAIRRKHVLARLECLGLENTAIGADGIRGLADALADPTLLRSLSTLYAFTHETECAEMTAQQSELQRVCATRGVATPGL